LAKFQANVSRDKRKAAELRRMGWRVVTVWECETADEARLAARLIQIFKISGRRSRDAAKPKKQR